MKNSYIKERAEVIASLQPNEERLFTEDTIQNLPLPLQQYLRKCGYLGTPIPYNADVYWKESFIKLKPGKKWSPLETIQFNSVNPIARIAYMRFLKMPVVGRDIYRNGQGEMKGKLFNLFTIIHGTGKEISQSALITAFCEFIFIPGYILQHYVKWEYVSDNAVRATLTDHGITVSGIFYFDSEGLFTRFETDDRYYAAPEGKILKTKFSAIVDSYQLRGGIKIVKDVRVVWHLQNGDYEYFRGTIDRIIYNVTK